MEEVLLQGGTDAELAETLDIGLYMGGSLAMKSVRYAFQMRDELGHPETRAGTRAGLAAPGGVQRASGQPETSPIARQ